jgi:hypothetical protein
MTFSSPSDSRLAAKAVREDWPMASADRAAAIAHLRAVVSDPTTRPQLLAIATNALATVEPVETPV